MRLATNGRANFVGVFSAIIVGVYDYCTEIPDENRGGGAAPALSDTVVAGGDSFMYQVATIQWIEVCDPCMIAARSIAIGPWVAIDAES